MHAPFCAGAFCLKTSGGDKADSASHRIGRPYPEPPLKAKGGGISAKEAEMLLRNDVAKVSAEMSKRCGGWDGLPDNLRRATANMGSN